MIRGKIIFSLIFLFYAKILYGDRMSVGFKASDSVKKKIYQKIFNNEDIYMNEKVDKEPYIKKLTNDKVINLTGQSGSGKTYYANKHFKGNKYLIVDTDDIFNESRFEHSSGINRELGEMFRKKYTELPDMGYKFDLVYEDILEYCNSKYQDKTVVIDCSQLYCVKDINNLKGKIIIMRTSVERCLDRCVKRYKKNYPKWTEDDIKKYIERKNKIYIWYNYLNEFIKKVDEL